MTYTVRFSPEADEQLATLEQYLTTASGSIATGEQYVDDVVSFCESLVTFPERGQRRDDLVPGLRITHYRSRAIIAFLVDTKAELVSIVGVFYGGQNYETAFTPESD